MSCVLLPAPAAYAATAAQKSACTTVFTLRGWYPSLTLAGAVPPQQAIGLLRQHLNWQQKIVTATELGPKAGAIQDQLWEAVRNFNLQGLYRKLPYQGGSWHSLTLHGQLTPTHYRVTETTPAAFDSALTALGDSASQLDMRPRPAPANGPSGDRYQLRGRLRANIGPIAWADVPKAAWASLHHLTQAAPLPLASGGGFVTGTGSDTEILLQLQPAFPNAFRWYMSIAAAPQLTAHDGKRGPARHMHLVLQLNDGLRKHYPQVAAYMEQLKNFIAADVVVENDAGRWLKVDLDSPDERLIIDGWVVDGHLVPSRNGVPQTAAIQPDESPVARSFRSVADLKLSALGVTVKLRHWPVDWRYTPSSHGAALVGRITQLPAVDVSGAALGIVPVGVVDAVIPGNIAGIVDDFMQVLTHSNAGQGALLKLDIQDHARDHPGSGSVVSASADGDTLDNFFVHFAVSLLNRRILPDDAQLQGIKRMASDGLTVVSEDLDGLGAVENRVHSTDLPALVEQCRSLH